MQDDRATLADLIRQLESPATPPTVRLQAAIMANRLARAEDDCEPAESLASEMDAQIPAKVIAALQGHTGATRAARRAFALSTPHPLQRDKDITMALIDDPIMLAQQVRDQLAQGDAQEARQPPPRARQWGPHNEQLARLEATANASDDKPQPVG